MPSTWGSLRALVIAASLLGLGVLVYLLRGVLSPLFFAWLLAYMLDPLVDRFEAVRIPRGVGIAILLALALAVLTLFSLLLLPAIVRDFVQLGHALYEGFTGGFARLSPWMRAHGVPMPDNAESAFSELGSKAFGLAPSALGPVGAAVEAAVGSTASLLSGLASLLIVPMFSFYFLYDFDRIVAAVRELLPASLRPQVSAMALEVDEVLGHFVRGQLTVMAILALLYGAGYAAVGVPLAIPIAVLAGALSFIPYVGSGLALALGLLMSILHYSGLGQIVGVVTVYVIVQALEGFVITPRVVGGRLGLSPVWVLFALLAFGQLFGFVGVMLALPASAVIKVFVVHAVERYRTSATYLGATPLTAAALRPGRLRLRRGRRDRAALRSGS